MSNGIGRFYNPNTGEWEIPDSGGITNGVKRYTVSDIDKIRNDMVKPEDIPKRVGQLENDKGYLTISDLPEDNQAVLKEEIDKLKESKAEKDHIHLIYEEKSNKNSAGGYAGLDANKKIPLELLPDISKQQTYILDDENEIDNIPAKVGDRAYVINTGDSYIFDGNSWRVESKAEWENINLQWDNIADKPKSSQSDIDIAVKNSHTHSNKVALDKVTDSLIDDTTKHLQDKNKHITATERQKWNAVENKVDKESGKGLSTNDFSDLEKDKLANIENGANKYEHPASHSASIIDETTDRQFVSQKDKENWNDKPNKEDLPNKFVHVGTNPPKNTDMLWIDIS